MLGARDSRSASGAGAPSARNRGLVREADGLTLPVFFKHPVGLTVGEIATLTGAKLRSGARIDDLITNVAPLNRAGASDLAFLDTAKYADVLTSTQAGACSEWVMR